MENSSMDDENRIPRVRIYENNFSADIKNPLYPEECMSPGGPIDYMIEVINANEEVIGLFFQVMPFLKNDYNNIIEFAKYYDSLFVYKIENEENNNLKKKYNSMYDKTTEEMMKSEYLHSQWSNYGWGAGHFPTSFDEICAISAYGRIKYPLGLDENHRKIYEEYETFFSPIDNGYDFLMGMRQFPGDLIDILKFSLCETELNTDGKSFNAIILHSNLGDFIDLGLEIISGISENLLTNENIYFFIDEAKHKDEKNVMDFLLEYKSEHFPSSKRSPDDHLFTIQRIRLLESDSPQMIPGIKKEFFIEVRESQGNTKALFFIPDCVSDLFLSDSFSEITLWESFTNQFDKWLEPYYWWHDVELQLWLPEYFKNRGWDIQDLLNDAGVPDIQNLKYYDIPDGWRDHIGSDDKIGPENSNLPALLLMAYGRLKYPYLLPKESKDNCELYVKGFVEKRDLIYEFQRISKEPKDIRVLFTFCEEVFPDKESFREAYINKNNITELVHCDLEIFTAIEESILSRENIDLFLNEAHAQNKPELMLFLLDYKNKHFTADENSLQLNPDY
jgi:hypothetical protein